MRILLIGYDGGLGKAISKVLDYYPNRIVQGTMNIMDKDAIYGFMEFQPAFDRIIYCAGVNKIDKFDDAVESDWWESMDVNCYGFVRLIKIIREKHKFNPPIRVCIVTSNAANIPMSHSLAYNCSKAAANMAIRQMAREISPEEMIIFGVAPNKLQGTPMSRKIEKKVCEMRDWTPEKAKQYQLAALPAHVETPPDSCAEFIEHLFNVGYPFIHGTIIPYGGPQ